MGAPHSSGWLQVLVICHLVHNPPSLFTPDMPDAMTRFGFPFLVYQDGGPVALCFFSRPALYGNIALAIALSIGLAAFFPCIRREILRTLGYERKIG
jgi:hypothetical protein